jgi:two-component system, sensor histidine kinase YesM
MVLITFAIGAVVLFIVTFFLSQYFADRINIIAAAMKRFKNGEKNVVVYDPHTDELGFLADTYNEMHNRIQLLISEVYEISLLKKDAELKALQAQINPHFLYNSLAYVGRVARYGNSQKINQMIEALAIFYRITLNKGKSIIPVQEELRQIKAYLEVFRIRMDNLFIESFQIEDEILDCLILKVILQPFVENILEHALGEREEPINIVIKGYRDENSVVLKVIDDGLGFHSEKVRLEDISTARGSGYGIRNVDERIKLQYGDNYGVMVFSRKGMGTTATITLPYLKN